MADVVALIDGFNLYHALDGRSHYGGGYPYHKYKWIDYSELARCFVPRSDWLVEVVLFTASPPWPGADGKRKRQAALIDANRDLGVLVVWGRFRPVDKVCTLEVPHARIVYPTYEEKRTDVAIAVGLVGRAYRKAYDKAVIISGDSDLIPAIQEAKTAHPNGAIISVVPIEHRGQALKNEVDLQIAMKAKHLAASRLPDPFTLRSGQVVHCPQSWKP